jgi:polyhydroxyalkanoate synthase subunit PhaC
MSDRSDAPGPLRRRGPRPLLLHLMLATMKSASSVPGWPNWNSASPLSSSPNQGNPAGAANALPAPDPALLAGIAAYRRHPYSRHLPDPPVLWSEGSTRLLDYLPQGSTGGGPPVLFVPSLINRAYVLDLAEGRSMMRYLARTGVRPLLLDWGWPGPVERRFNLTDYVAGRLDRAIEAVGEPVILAGYCMGGLLALAAAQRRPDRLRALALLATPWDFHAGMEDAHRAALPGLRSVWSQAAGLTGALPVDLLQVSFSLLDPQGIAGKYRDFARLDQSSPRAAMFVALEDWLNDGVPLAAPVAEECLSGWYMENLPARNEWRIAGLPVLPETLRLPTLVVVPGKDRIVPPASAQPLARLIPGARLLQPPAGHIGMATGSRARAQLWQPFTDWLTSLQSL